MAFIFYLFISFAAYLLLTIDSGSFFLLWSRDELIAGSVVSIIVASLSYRFVPPVIRRELVNPFKAIVFILYLIIPFLFSLIVANVEVAYRVLTGRIKPAVVKLDTKIESPLGIFFLANSITLSPGTLSLELDDENNSIYIHCLYWKKKRGESFKASEIAPYIYFWLKKIYK